VSALPLEDDEQRTVVRYCAVKGHRLHHSNNEMYTKSWKQKARSKSLGVSSGFPDLLIIVNNKLIAIEMKRVKGGVVSDNQREWLQALDACGIPSYVCRGADEAITVIKSFE
jgi:VRR-NUC domain